MASTTTTPQATGIPASNMERNQDRQVIMGFQVNGSVDKFYIGTTNQKLALNPSVKLIFNVRSIDTLHMRLAVNYNAKVDGVTHKGLKGGDITLVPRTRNGTNQITCMRLHAKGTVDAPHVPERFSMGEFTKMFEWSHYMECSFNGCFVSNWTTDHTLSPEVQQILKALKDLEKGGVICFWIGKVGSNDSFLTNFLHRMETAEIPWTSYRGTQNSAHWIEFAAPLPPLTNRLDKRGIPYTVKESSVVHFLDLHAYEVYLAVAVKRDDQYQTAQLRSYEGVMHTVNIKAVEGAAFGYLYMMVKVHEQTKRSGKIPGAGTSFQIDWYIPGRTSEDPELPVWEGTVVQKPVWTDNDVDFVMVTKQPPEGQMPSMTGGMANLSAVFGHASAMRKIKAIHRLCYDSCKSPMLSRMRTILLARDFSNLELVDLCSVYADWQKDTTINAVMEGLNEYQQFALKHVLCAPGGIGIITGPPGTGKTHLIVALTKVLTILGWKVLLCAPSNESTDHLAGSIHRKYPELGTIRVYRPTAEESHLKSGQAGQEEDENDEELISRNIDVINTLAQVKGDKRNKMTHKVLSLSERCVREAQRIQERNRESNFQETGNLDVSAFLRILELYRDKLRPTKSHLKESGKQLKKLSKSILGEAKVVVTTCNGGDCKDIRQFYQADVVIFDEAAQTDEPDTLIPLTRESVMAVILVGDAKQLQPVVVSGNENEFGTQLEQSMQSRLVSAGYPSFQLRIQYRMLPSIAEWPNLTFYNGSLLDHESTQFKRRPLAASFQNYLHKTWNVKGTNRLMVEPSIKQAICGPSGSLTNHGNIDLVLYMIGKLVDQGEIRSSQVSIITFYELQRLNYVRVLETLRMTKPELYQHLQDVEVATVDSFQGRENEIIFLDLVVVGERSGVGFVRDPRRLNVATTRAKCGLVIVGNSSMCVNKPKSSLELYKYLESMLGYLGRDGIITGIGTPTVASEILKSDLMPIREKLITGAQPGSKRGHEDTLGASYNKRKTAHAKPKSRITPAKPTQRELTPPAPTPRARSLTPPPLSPQELRSPTLATGKLPYAPENWGGEQEIVKSPRQKELSPLAPTPRAMSLTPPPLWPPALRSPALPVVRLPKPLENREEGEIVEGLEEMDIDTYSLDLSLGEDDKPEGA
jgi:AAA domain